MFKLLEIVIIWPVWELAKVIPSLVNVTEEPDVVLFKATLELLTIVEVPVVVLDCIKPFPGWIETLVPVNVFDIPMLDVPTTLTVPDVKLFWNKPPKLILTLTCVQAMASDPLLRVVVVLLWVLLCDNPVDGCNTTLEPVCEFDCATCVETVEIIKPFAAITIPEPPVNAEIDLVLVKYKFDPSLILLVVNIILPVSPFTESTELVNILPLETIKPFDWITIPDPAVNAEIALVFVK